jgi:LCP family protein required for cell wall assembly
MFNAHGGTVIAGKVGYVVSCLLAATVLTAGWYAHRVENDLGGIASSSVATGGPQTGAMNILLMGLESRTDYNGNTLSSSLLTAMHAGSVYGVNNLHVGGQDTNTLILIHIFAGGRKAVGYSIPRDDVVDFPKPYDGESQGKIDQAYGLAWAQSLNETVNSSMSHDQRYFQANEAGQAAAIDTVSALTGVHIDHFAEVNLAGFFYLAQAFDGIYVCVRPWEGGRNLHDANSGFNQKHAGYLHLSAPQALAYVRERDNLPNGDLDRTHRQQAVIDYVMWKLKHQGVLSDLGQIDALLSTAKKFVITSGGWQLAVFAGEMQALTGRNLTFKTLPIAGTQNGYVLNGVPQDVNLVNKAYVQQVVHNAFYPPPAVRAPVKKSPAKTTPIPSPSTVTVDVYNGNSAATGLAGAVSRALVSAGYKPGAVENASAQSVPVQSATQILYGAGATANAAKIARYFGATAVASKTLPAGHVEVLLGATAAGVPAGLGSSSTATSGTATSDTATSGTPAAAPSVTSTAGADNGQAGSAVTVKANARYGVPCVY